MMSIKRVFVFSALILLTIFSGCSTAVSAKPVVTPTVEWKTGMPREGQPTFPALGQYWIIDNGCGFDQQKMKIADTMFERLRKDGIAEVAVICQTGIVNKGATNNDKIWLRDWARWAEMGSVEDSRSIVWLIRPDVKPEESRIAIEISRWLYWYTAIDYADTLGEASNYANVKDYSGALVSIARNTDESLRRLWLKQEPTITGSVKKN